MRGSCVSNWNRDFSTIALVSRYCSFYRYLHQTAIFACINSQPFARILRSDAPASVAKSIAAFGVETERWIPVAVLMVFRENARSVKPFALKPIAPSNEFLSDG